MKTLVFALLFFLISTIPTFAHSGRTNSSGCHNCNVGSCAGTYHCHNGGYVAPAPAKINYVATPLPTPKPTAIPTPKIIPTPSLTPSAQPSASPTPMVESAATELTPPPKATPLEILGYFTGVITFGALSFGLSYLGLKWLAKITAPKV